MTDTITRSPDLWGIRAGIDTTPRMDRVSMLMYWYYVAGFFFSLLVGLLLETMDNRIYTAGEAAKKLGLFTIKVKDMSKRKLPVDSLSVIKNKPGGGQILNNFEQVLSFLKNKVFSGDITGKIIAIVSADDSVGKTFTACNLAFACVKNSGNTLLIDADMRSPSIDTIFGFEGKAKKGLTDVLRGSSNIENSIRNITDLLLSGSLEFNEGALGGMDNLKMILSGTKAENPLGVMKTENTKKLFKELATTYGTLIVDTSALGNSPDALNVVPAADAVVVVAKKGKSTYESIEEIINQIQSAGGNPSLLVFNYV